MKRWIKGSIITILTLIGFILIFSILMKLLTSFGFFLYDPPGKLVSVGDYRLHLNCSGQGKPVVILDSGLGGNVMDWAIIQPKISEITEVCSYDRAGLGWSDKGPLPRDSKQFVQELHTLLKNAGVEPPYVMVGQSLGGINVRMYASEFPDEVVGMVLVDSSHEYQIDALPDEPPKGYWGEFKSWLKEELMWKHPDLGLSRIFIPLYTEKCVSGFTPRQRFEFWSMVSSPQSVKTTMEENHSFVDSLDEMKEYRKPMGDIPLIVLTSGRKRQGNGKDFDQFAQEERTRWFELQADLSKLSTQGSQQIIEDSGHMIHWEQPDTVIAAITNVVQRAKGLAGKTQLKD